MENYNCDCGFTGGCSKCNPIITTYKVNKKVQVKVWVAKEELEKYGYGWQFADKPFSPILVEGILYE